MIKMNMEIAKVTKNGPMKERILKTESRFNPVQLEFRKSTVIELNNG